jgi:hypothetical protein
VTNHSLHIGIPAIAFHSVVTRNGPSVRLHWLISKRSPLSLTNKILIYKMVLKPIWTYGLKIGGCTAASNLAVIQRYQPKTLRQITNAPWYVTNHTLHTDLRIAPVRTVFQKLTETHHTTLKSHPNPLIATILATPPRRRLRRRWTLDENSKIRVAGRHLVYRPNGTSH